MKKIAKILCALLCLAMVLSFASVAFAAEDTYATIDFADKSFRTSLDKSAKEQVWESNGLKITVGNEKEYDDHVRFNKNNKVTIEYPGMKNIVFVCPHDIYAGYFESIVDGMEGVSVSVENYTATITFDEPCDSWTIEKIASATRVEKMTVYTGDVFDVEDEVIEPDVVDVPEAGKAYKFAYETEIKVYANGKAVAATSSLGADKDLKDAADVYLETTEGGYYFYFLLDGAKKYINVVNMKPTLQDTGATVYTYDEELMTLVTDIEGVSYAYGLEGGISGSAYALKLLLTSGEKIVAYANFFAQSEGESDEPVVSAVELQEGVNNFSEDTTFAFTAPANGTLTLNVNTASLFTTPGTIADAAYSVNGGEFINLTRGVSEDIELNAGDEVIVEGYATAAAKLTVVWTATPAACQHTNTKVEGAVEATCTAAGFTGNTVCADCGEQIAAGTEIAALPHAFAEGKCTVCGAADPDYVAPVVENKTITIGDKTFTTVDGKWAFNQEMTAASSTGYNMIIMTKAFTGSFATNGYGVAIVLDQYGTLVRVYDGANVGYWTVDGKAASAHFGANDYAITAWNELQEGETLVVFTHTGSEGNVARQFGLNVRSLCGKTAALTGFEFAAAPCKHTNTKVEGAVEATCEDKGYTGDTVCTDCGETVTKGTEIAALGHNYVDGICTNCNNPKTFDAFGIMVAVMAASGTALVVLKKKED